MNIPESRHVKETHSTNDYIRELLNDRVLEDGFSVFADFQTTGKGQKGNSWESAPGKNLLFSIVFFPDELNISQHFIIAQVVSLAIKEILEEETDGISIKWPNDIYWEEKKITGILIENEIMGNFITRSIIGAGINLNQDLFLSDAPNPVSLKQITGKTYNIKYILDKIIGRIFYYYNLIQFPGERNVIMKLYNESLFRKESYHKFEDKTGIFLAKIIEVEESGLFVLEKESGEIKKYLFKEIKYIF